MSWWDVWAYAHCSGRLDLPHNKNNARETISNPTRAGPGQIQELKYGQSRIWERTFYGSQNDTLCYDRMFNYHTIVNLTASCHSVSVIFSYAQAGI